jgi:hypothetical protein
MAVKNNLKYYKNKFLLLQFNIGKNPISVQSLNKIAQHIFPTINFMINFYTIHLKIII